MLLATVGSVMQGSIGFGLAVVAAPVLLMVNPVFVPGPLLLDATVLVALMAVRERRDVIVGDIGLATIGRILGTLPAAYAVSTLPVSVYELLFALLILLGVLISALGWHIPATPRNVIAAGILSGFASTISSVGGPPMALVYQHEKGPRIRGTLSAIFTIGAVVSLIGLWWIGRFGRTELLLGLLLLPGVVVGFAVSRYTTQFIDRVHIRPAVLAVSALAALAILVRVLL
ncbi:MAG: sulfite exporter TauE/SafE family protein [Planctomycetes bacterium]|nr:sulfite exporter TauE/SafE family protein [Planctomycetota bacterium]